MRNQSKETVFDKIGYSKKCPQCGKDLEGNEFINGVCNDGMHSHTPGPWHISKIANNYDQYEVYAEDGSHGQTVTTFANGEANAELIALAPELLEQLQAARQWIVSGEVDGVGMDETGVLDSIDATLAKIL